MFYPLKGEGKRNPIRNVENHYPTSEQWRNDRCWPLEIIRWSCHAAQRRMSLKIDKETTAIFTRNPPKVREAWVLGSHSIHQQASEELRALSREHS